jgi:hypothetical protein
MRTASPNSPQDPLAQPERFRVFFAFPHHTALVCLIQKCHAYACADIAAQLHRQHCYRVRFNRDPRHPMVEELIEELPCASADPQDPDPHAT